MTKPTKDSKRNVFFQMMFDKYPARSNVQHAREIGITYPYLAALMRGDRPTEQASVDVVRKFARYVDMSPLQVSFYFNIFQNTDFQIEVNMETKIEAAFDQIKKDKIWGMYMPPKAEFDSMDKNLQMLIVLMFNELQTVQNEVVGLAVPEADGVAAWA